MMMTTTTTTTKRTEAESYILSLVTLFCFGDCIADSAPEPSTAPGASGSSLSPTGKLVLYAAAIGTFFLLGICFLYCALPSKTRSLAADDPAPSSHRMQFEDQDLRLATRGYHEHNLIGSTQLGSVFKGILPDGFVVAIKRFNLTKSDEASKRFFELSNALTAVRHRNLVRVLGCAVDSDYKHLVMEYVDCQSLDKHLHPKCNLSWETRLKIAQGIARALVYMHAEGGVHSNGPIVHGNLKPGNIFVDMDRQEPLLTDYGIASLIEKYHDSSSALPGLSGYTAPECKPSGAVTSKSDVYSYGMILLQLLTLKQPTSEDVSGDLLGWIRYKVTDRYAEILDPAIVTAATESRKKKIKRVLGLALLCTRHDPQNRPSMKKVLEMLNQMKSFRSVG